MTVNAETAKSGPYTGNGSTTVHAYAFKVLDAAHIVVTQTVTATGVETVKTLTTHFTVSGVGSDGGGNVTMETAAPSTATITITRAVPQTQTTDLVNRGAVVPATIETALDRGVQQVQDFEEEMSRGIKFKVSADLSSFNTTVPAPVASKIIGINAANTAFELVADPSASATAAAASAVTSASEATAAAASAVTAASEASAAQPKYTFSTTTTAADPGAGVLRYNNASVASVTAIYIDNTTADTGNPDIAAWILSWDSSTSTIHSQIRLVEPGTPANYAVFNVTNAVDSTGFVTLTVEHIDSNGTFANADSIRISNSRTGDKGDTGSTGSTGATGPAASVISDTTPQLGGFLDANSKFISHSQGAAIASVAGDTNIWANFDGNTVHITGTNAMTDFGTPKSAGDSMWLIFDAAASVVDSSTITVVGNANFQAAANDMALVYALTTSTFLFIPFPNAGSYTPIDTIDNTHLKNAFVGDHTEVTVATGNSILLADASGNTKRDTVQGILDLVPASGEQLKGWLSYDQTGTAAILDSLNVTSVADTATGNWTVTWGTDFADTNYLATPSALTTGGTYLWAVVHARAAGTTQVITGKHSDNGLADSDQAMVLAIGDQ
jgi:hypothetical protein